MKNIFSDAGKSLRTGLASAKSTASSVKISSSPSGPVSCPSPDLSSVSITLSDSDGSDVEILPLADRMRGEGRGEARGRSEEEQSTRRGQALSLTPAQMAGRAAVRRQETSSGERAAGAGVNMTHRKTGRRKRREELGSTDDEDDEFPIFSQTNASSQPPVSPAQATAKLQPTVRLPVPCTAPPIPMPATSTARAGPSSASTEGVATHRHPNPPGLPSASSRGGDCHSNPSSAGSRGGGQGNTDLGKPLFELKPGTAVGMGMGTWRYETDTLHGRELCTCTCMYMCVHLTSKMTGLW